MQARSDQVQRLIVHTLNVALQTAVSSAHVQHQYSEATLAALPAGLLLPGALSAQWEFDTDMQALSLALFGLVYRYAARPTGDPASDKMLGQGAVGHMQERALHGLHLLAGETTSVYATFVQGFRAPNLSQHTPDGRERHKMTTIRTQKDFLKIQKFHKFLVRCLKANVDCTTEYFVSKKQRNL